MSSISNFTNSDQYTTLLGALTDEGRSLIHIKDDTIDPAEIREQRTAEGKPNTHIYIENYTAPAQITLDTAYSLGQKFDDMIKDNIAVQVSGIKGSDILCSTFCIIVSMLSCSKRNELYKTIRSIQSDLAAAGQMAAAANELVMTANAMIAGAETIADSASSIFSKNPINTSFDQQETGMSATAAIATLNSYAASVSGVIETFERGINILADNKAIRPVNVTGRIWDFAKNMLFQLQCQALSFANDAIDSVINPIEEKIREWVPSECGTRGYAWRFFQKIIDAIKREKQWILNLISDIFAAGNDFSDSMGNFTKGSLLILETRAFIDALKMVSGKFGDLAISCGVSPCDDSLSSSAKNMADSIKSGISPSAPIGTANVITSLPEKGSSNLDDISKVLSDMLDMDNDNIIVNGDNIMFINTVAKNAPSKIKELIDLNDLGSDFSIYDNGTEIKVVHTFKRMCSGE